jgi:hypothetical protein
MVYQLNFKECVSLNNWTDSEIVLIRDSIFNTNFSVEIRNGFNQFFINL